MIRETVMVGVVLAASACGEGAGQPSDPAPDAAAGECGAPMVLFLNRGGGSYQPGTDDSSANRSALLPGAAVVAAPAIGEADWFQLVACVTDRFAPFNVEVTDVDPGAAVHREAVFVGNPDVVPPLDNPTIDGVAPQSCADLDELRGLPAIVFLNATGFEVVASCELTARLVGSTLSLDSTTKYCPDLMSPIGGCGFKSFVDEEYGCNGECTCGGNTQNSYQTLLAIAGARCE